MNNLQKRIADAFNEIGSGSSSSSGSSSADLLWTNSNITNRNGFASQTLHFDTMNYGTPNLYDYDELIIYFANGVPDGVVGMDINSARILRSDINGYVTPVLTCFDMENDIGITLYKRYMYIATDKIDFYDTQCMGIEPVSYTDNTRIIPLYIVGIKNGLIDQINS